MVSEHILTRSLLLECFYIRLYHVTRTNRKLTPISSISVTLSSSSPEINSTCTTKTSDTSSTMSEVSASISSEITSSNSDNTLSMITTPWTTESWYSESIVQTFDTYSETVTNTMTDMTSISLNPETTSSIGGITPDLNSMSINTITLLDIDDPKSCFSVNLRSIPSEAKPKRTMGKSYSESTFESWTVESFTSFVKYSDSKIIKVRYPWSPSTYLSGTDVYPDSVDTFRSSVISLEISPTLNSMKQSVDTLP